MGQRRRADPTLANDRAAAQCLKLCREGFEVGAGDCRAMQVREFVGVGDQPDFLAQALRNSLKPYFQRFDDGLLLREDQTFLVAFLDTFLAELFGERTRFFATFLAELFSE